MKKLALLLFLFVGVFTQAQIDYDALVRNLEEISPDTNIREFLKGLPFEEDDYDDGVSLIDERFLRFYGVIVDKMEYGSSWSGSELRITPFEEISDFELIKSKLIETYGEPESDIESHREAYEWSKDSKRIQLAIDKEDGIFKEFRTLLITFSKQ